MAYQSLTSGILSPEHNVSRYCRPRWLVDGIVTRDAFLLRPEEQFLSVNWLESFHIADRPTQLEGVRATLAGKGFGVSPNGRFAILNVGIASQHVMEQQGLRLLFQLLGQAHDPSHCGIFGYGHPDEDSKGIDAAQSLAASVDEVYPASAQNIH